MLISDRFGFVIIPVVIIAATVCCLALQEWEWQRIDVDHSGAAVFVGSELDEATRSASLALKLPNNPEFVCVDDIIQSSRPNSSSKQLLNGALKASPNQYLFLGYLSESEEDLSDLAQYCVARAVDGQVMADVIPLASARGDGRNALLRAPLPKDRPAGSAWSNWYQDPSRVPVFVERSCLEGDGGYVIFLDGSFKYFPYARGSVWPLTRHGIGSIRTIANPVPDTK